MKNQREIKKKDPEFYRKLLALLIPMVVQNLMNALVSASDALMVGTLDQNSLSAVSLATQISFVLNLFYCGDYDRNNGHGRLFPAESGWK